MSHSSDIFERQPVTVQNLNGFDLSHSNKGTAKCGQLMVTLRKLLMQDTKISVGMAAQVELPPLATSFFGKIDFCTEVFFVPCAVLYAGWRQFISNQVANLFPQTQSAVQSNGGYELPVIDLGWTFDSATSTMNRTWAGTRFKALDAVNDGIGDSLGLRMNPADPPGSVGQDLHVYVNMLPFLAYHKIVDTYYRNATTTRTWFAVNPQWEYVSGSSPDVASPQMSSKNVSLVWHSYYTSKTFSAGSGINAIHTGNRYFSKQSELTFPDGIDLLQTRQRTYSRDYFVAASLNPQQGNPATLTMTPDAQGDTNFTVSALRNIVALQRFEEKLNYDPTYRGIMRNLFGSTPSDALLDEPTYIGRVVIPVYQKSVYQNTGSDSAYAGGSRNPFASDGVLGARGGTANFTGEGQICQNYRIGCFGYLMALSSLVPHAAYGYGLDREMLAIEIGDFPFPDLQSVGMDQIYLCEVYADSVPSAWKNTWAFLPRYSWMKYKNDEIHGELRPGRSLESFVLQRDFSNPPTFGTDFVTIAQSDMDGILAVDTLSTKLTCWYEIYWQIKAVMPLAAFCVPTLGELHDVHTINTTQGGSRL